MEQQRATVVRIYSDCMEPDYTSPEWQSDEPGEKEIAPWIQWNPPASATGVAITEKEVLTAAHAVRCPIIPDVLATTLRGKHFPMIVVRDAGMFEDGTDLARLEVVGAYDRLGISAMPPLLGKPDYDDVVCAQPFGRDEVCGPMVGLHTFEAPTIKGDSGAPVYDGDVLIGLVIKGDGRYTEYVPIDSSWLKGT